MSTSTLSETIVTFPKMSDNVFEKGGFSHEERPNEARQDDSSDALYNRPQRERTLLRKQDLIILPLMSISYMFSYMVFPLPPDANKISD
jgi:hypothetical protein